MKSMNPALIKKVRTALSGKRLEKFDASIAILNESLAQGAWTPRGSVKANSGFYQGLAHTRWERREYGKTKAGRAEEAAWCLDHCLQFGGGLRNDKIDLDLAIKTLRDGRQHYGEPVKPKLSDDVIKAWVALCQEKNAAYELLHQARPKPVLTKILLSPKVTKTLIECNLDLDLPSIRMADLVPKKVPAWKRVKKMIAGIEREIWAEAYDEKGKRLMQTIYVVKWSKGIVHGQSRFGSGCHACGKWIPSGRYVPIEAKDKRSGKLISMWIGCDCARNIFGIKDIGIKKDPKEPQ